MLGVHFASSYGYRVGMKLAYRLGDYCDSNTVSLVHLSFLIDTANSMVN